MNVKPGTSIAAWIPLKERQPEDFAGWYLAVIHETNDLGTSTFIEVASWSHHVDSGHGFHGITDRGLSVTHWAELPALPAS